MSARRMVLRALPGLCVLMVGLVSGSVSASAAITHHLLSRITEVPASSGVPVTGPLEKPSALTADAGTLYVLTGDYASGVMDEYDSSGVFTSQVEVDKESSQRSVAVSDITGATYVGHKGAVSVYSPAGSLLGNWTGADTPAGSFHQANSRLAVAADNSSNLADPDAGDVYVGDESDELVDVFKPEAAGKEKYITQITGTPSVPLHGLKNIAVDPSTGNVYVSVVGFSNNEEIHVVDIFKPLALDQYEFAGRLIGPPNLQFNEIGGIAIDPADGDVYISNMKGGVSTVEEFSSTGVYLGQLVGEPQAPFSEVAGLAVNSSGDVYVAESTGGAVDVFGPNLILPDVSAGAPTNLHTTAAKLNGTVNPDGSSVTDCEFEYGSAEGPYENTVPCSQTSPLTGQSPVPVSAEVSGLTIASPYRYRIKATNATGTNTSQPIEFETLSIAPSVEGESVSNIGNTVATLHARINQQHVATIYHFEYGPTESYGTSVPVPDRALGSSLNETEVDQAIFGLEGGTTYHYRVVATNAEGTADGPDQSFTTFTSSPVVETENCPNAALRAGGQSRNLPDCRAYEMVSPVQKNGANVEAQGDSGMASVSGDEIAYGALGGFANTTGSASAGLVQYVAFRGERAWSTYAVTPTPSNTAILVFGATVYNRLFSEDFTTSEVEGWVLPAAEAGIPNAENLYRENVRSQSLETLTKAQEDTTSAGPLALQNTVRGASADLSVIAFETPDNFSSLETGSSPKLYAWDHGTLHLVGILPDDSIPAGGSTSVYESAEASRERHEGVSTDGSRIFFMATPNGASAPQLYMRENEERTVWISQSETSTPDPEPQEVKFQGATPDGSKVVFSTPDRLLNADPGGPGYALYMYTNSPSPETESNLTFIGRFTDLQGFNGPPEVVGMGTDAKRIYFTTREVAASNIFPLELWDEGKIETVTELRADLSSSPGGGSEPVVSSDGQRIAFLAGNLPNNRSEMDLYDAASKTLMCVSCSASKGTMLGVEPNPAATKYFYSFSLGFPHRFMSSDGRFIFFTTPDALLPQDTNGLSDVYEYDAETGKLALISSGTGNAGTWFMDASASGRDAFFVSEQSYGRADKDTLVDLYDARVDGGLPEPPPTPVPCAGDACQGVPSAAPTFNTSSGFEGLGNAAKKTAPPAAKKETRARKLANALRTCRRKKGKKRMKCERQADKRFKAKKSSRGSHATHPAGR